MSSSSSTESLEWLADNLKLEAMTSQWQRARQQVALMQQAFLATRLEVTELRAQNEKLQQQLNRDLLLESSGVSVVTALLWKASDSPKVVKSLLESKSKLKCLFNFFHRKLEKYDHLKDLHACSDEATDLFLSLGGIIVNLVASTDACDFALSSEDGRQLFVKIIQLLEHLDKVPPSSPTEKHLKSIFLMILYNISIEAQGFQLIKDNGSVTKALSRDLIQEDEQDIKLLEARILYSFMCHDDVALFKGVESILTTEELSRISEELNDSKDSEEVKLLMKCFIQCLGEYKEMTNMIDALEAEEKCMLTMPEDELIQDLDEKHIAEDCKEDQQLTESKAEDTTSSGCCSFCFDVVPVK